MNINTVSRSVFVGLVARQDFELEVELVDRDRVLPRVVLPRSGQESLREEEAGYPEHDWFAVLVPVLDA